MEHLYKNFCTSCGKKNTQNSKFCVHCGENLEKYITSQSINNVEKQPYSFAKRNFILLAIASIISIMINFLNKPDIISSYAEAEFAGRIIGTILGIFLLPFLFSLFVWAISKKNNHYGQTTFTIVIAFLMFFNFSQLKFNKNNLDLHKMEKKYSSLKKNMKDYITGKSTKRPEVKGFTDSLINYFDQMGIDEETSKTIKEFFNILLKNNLGKIIDKIYQLNIYDLSKIKKTDFYLHKKLILKYEKYSKNVFNYIKQFPNKIKKMSIEAKNEKKRKFLKGFLKGLSRFKELENMIENHKNLSIYLKKYNNLLIKNWGKSKYDKKSNTIIFYNEKISERYSKIIKEITKIENAMEQTNKKIYNIQN